jgi:hypothetical protein
MLWWQVNVAKFEIVRDIRVLLRDCVKEEIVITQLADELRVDDESENIGVCQLSPSLETGTAR